MRLFLLVITLTIGGQLAARDLNYRILWQNEVTKDQDDKARIWLDSLVSSTYRALGKYPRDLRFFMTHRKMDHALGRAYVLFPKKNRGVYFTIDTSYPLDDFLDDWTPSHEISHLALPFMGKPNRWLSEGFATFMTRYVMMELGYYNSKTIKEYYHESFLEVDHYFNQDMNFVDAAKEMVANHQYRAYYRAGSAFFYLADHFIHERHGKHLADIVYVYQNESKTTDRGIEEIFSSLDEIIGEPIIQTVLYNCQVNSAREVMDFILSH